MLSLALVVLKDKTGVLGPGLGLESLVLGPGLGGPVLVPGLGLESLLTSLKKDFVQVLWYKQGMMQTKGQYYRTRRVCSIFCCSKLEKIVCKL